MNRLRLIMAVMTGKLVITLSRWLGNQGSNFPGRLALRFYPAILQRLAGNVEQGIFIITGTNGKTTTSNMLAEILRESGHTVIHNRAGANMITGIITAFIAYTNITGTKKYDYAVLETDEANVPLVVNEVHPRLILITNFFRDQLDRYGELDHTINMIKE